MSNLYLLYAINFVLTVFVVWYDSEDDYKYTVEQFLAITMLWLFSPITIWYMLICLWCYFITDGYFDRDWKKYKCKKNWHTFGGDRPSEYLATRYPEGKNSVEHLKKCKNCEHTEWRELNRNGSSWSKPLGG